MRFVIRGEMAAVVSSKACYRPCFFCGFHGQPESRESAWSGLPWTGSGVEGYLSVIFLTDHV